jgi:hypothetical protein
MSRHYHVLTGMGGGYMPDGNDFCSTRASAEDTAKWHADEWRERIATDDEKDPTERYRIDGNKRSGYVIGRPGNPHCLGHYIEIVACQEADCGEGEE